VSNNTTHSVDTFFENTGGGVGAPSARLSAVDDFVFGEIVDQAIVDKKKFGKDEVETDRDGNPVKQLVVILQTDLRNWEAVSKIPTNEDGSQKAASEDDGRRAVYVAPWQNLHSAIGDAVVAETGSKGPLLNGAKLGVKIVELKDTGKGNPLKIHGAKYVAPSASDGFFGESTTGSNDVTPSEATQPAQQAQQPAAQATPAPAAQQDPWANDAAQAAKVAPGQTDKPPF
jgi:hypothetical protein